MAATRAAAGTTPPPTAWPAARNALLLGALALSGVAAVAVRAPAGWREWRRPGAVPPGSGALAVAFWQPRRRLSIRSRANDLALTLRGERFDRPSDELGRLLERLRTAA